MKFTLSRRKPGRRILYISKKRICITVTSQVNSNESNNPNTYNSNNVIENSNLPHINVHNECSSNELISVKKKTYTESSTSYKEENMDDSNASEEINT